MSKQSTETRVETNLAMNKQLGLHIKLHEQEVAFGCLSNLRSLIIIVGKQEANASH